MLNVKRLLPIAVLLFAACKQDNPHTDSYVHAKVDSIVGSKMEEINRKAMEDLDQRMAIQVKQIADSIIAARKAAATPASPAADSLQTPPLPRP